jgi:ribosomal protein S18 acetylase RimI-like enzyme
MTREEYQHFREWSIRDYAEEMIQSRVLGKDDAWAKSREDIDKLLPDGPDTKGHFLFSIVAEPDGQRVGSLWFSSSDPGGSGGGFVYYLVVTEQFRRRGHAFEAMRAIERFAAKQGLTRIDLHAFGHNISAIALYRKLGYQTVDITMSKSLET